MFKFLPLFVLAVLAAGAVALPVDKERPEVAILESSVNQDASGSYHLKLETGDGTSRDEVAQVVNEGTDEQALEVKGSYKYIDDEGQEVEVFYTAGVNGFVPYGKTINADITKTAQEAKDLPRYTEEELRSRKQE
ncbi:Cpr47Ec [Drosophila busckii]|uniref:Cpr47Ec n=1 Tax=Drosophila busckii TaxID=30019 RepID=A0A0M3QUZ1_DROBS|nr:endocuticle structural protein SgAbd-6 [Drosophila busckii]ALC41473.1 Cpr47Ec [Drosophila busckii]